ncbi:MAG: type II secretion system F family protein [Ilumatobacteraceae bacterium]
MRVEALFVAVCAAAVVAGGALAWSGLRYAPSANVGRRVSPLPLLGGLLGGLLVEALAGWLLVAAIVGVLVAWGVARWRARDRGDELGAARVEALASWVENVRDVLQAAGQPIGAIGATADTCPPVLRQHVRALFARLSAGQPPEIVFRRFADELDDPLADLVAVGLLIAVTRGAQTEQVLTALAEQARHQADRRRIVEAERAPARREVQLVSLVMCALLAGMFVFARSSYLDAYDTLSGQVFLGAVVIGYALLLVRVGRLSRFPRPSRFLTLEPPA